MARYRVTVQQQGESDERGDEIGKADTFVEAQRLAREHADEHGRSLGTWKSQGDPDEPRRGWCPTLGEEFTYVVRRG